MKTIKPILVVLAALFMVGTIAETKIRLTKIFNKVDANYLFSLDRRRWLAYVERMTAPNGWKSRIHQIATGTHVMTYRPENGVEVSIQPFFSPAGKTPEMLIVSSYYPEGSLPTVDEKLKAQLRRDTEKQLGSPYSVFVVYSRTPPTESIQLIITTKEKNFLNPQ